ncbi:MULTISPECIES: hypothetical protein [unclassified Acinetobacter]|uniref:hypothetical protein n=1 Tax=unclassified Acinetobacter TaxID=196816 RepID=UPI0015D0FD32|nr:MULTISPECIES: hypothetical protein [unclassified Acinetobacter]
MKHHAHKVYFFKNEKILVLYKVYFFKTYFCIYENFLDFDRDFNSDASRYVDFTYLSNQQTEDFFSSLNMANYKKVPHFYDKD